jgi:hypothetical protein
MTLKEKHVEFIQRIIRDNRLIEDRVWLLKLQGYKIDTFAFGSGGVGQIKEMKSGKTRVRISYDALGVEL